MFRLYAETWHRNVLLKARQYGYTTFLDLWFLDQALFHPNIRCGIIADTLDNSKFIFRDKVKFPFQSLGDILPDEDPDEFKAVNEFGLKLKEKLFAKSERADEILFSNNSSIRVSTSMRGGTYQLLHVSEYGKIAANNPDKAVEVRTGAFEAVPKKGFIFVESTAEGHTGDFFELCELAQQYQQEERELAELDFKFHFHPWWENPDRILDVHPDTVLSEEMKTYFDDLEADESIPLTLQQKAWYISKEATLRELMMREHPSTPEEAFKSSLEGACFRREMSNMRKEKRITNVNWQRECPVNSFWDFGHGDATIVLLHQKIGANEHHFIDYIEESGQSITYFIKWLKDKPYIYGRHYFPHDAAYHSLQTGKRLLDTFYDLGVVPNEVMTKIKTEREGIEHSRIALATAWFDRSKCGRMVNCLDNYRHAWNERTKDWSEKPLHDWSSHAVKAFELFARAYLPSTRKKTRSRRRKGWKVL